MKITIHTSDGYTQTGSLEVNAPAPTVSKAHTTEKKGDNLQSIADFQKLLGRAIKNTSTKRVATVSGINTPVTRKITDVSDTTESQKVTSPKIDTSKYDGITIEAPDDLKEYFHNAAEKYGVDEKLLIAIAYHESRFDANATSSSGAMGIMQLMPGTAGDQGVKNAYDPEENIMGGAKLISYLMDHYDGDLAKAMAASSNGMGTVDRYGGVPPIKQAQEFVAYINKVYPDSVISGS